MVSNVSFFSLLVKDIAQVGFCYFAILRYGFVIHDQARVEFEEGDTISIKTLARASRSL